MCVVCVREREKARVCVCCERLCVREREIKCVNVCMLCECSRVCVREGVYMLVFV